MMRATILFAATLAAFAASAAGLQFAPWKDDLFRYPAILASEDNGDFVVVSYDKQRDLYGRDQVPERRAKPRYVSQVSTRPGTYNGAGVRLRFMGAGRVDGGATAIVIYIHGQGGNRYQGANQWTFGGNFNRVMNLMVRAGGAYISPDFTDINEAGVTDIAALVQDQAKQSPGAAIFIACGSQGGAICWGLARDPAVTPLLAGLLLLGSTHDDAFLKSPSVKGGRPLPIYIGHGTEDPIFAWQGERDFYRALRKAAPGYPVKLALFDTGVHGTPIRMTDWRLVLNWMLAAGGR